MEAVAQNPNLPGLAGKVEQTYATYGDTVVFAADAEIAREVELFSDTSKSEIYRNLELPLTTGEVIEILGIRATHNVIFAGATAADQAQAQKQWEDHTYLEIKLREKSYPVIRIANLLPWTNASSGAGLALHDKQRTWFNLHDPIVIPERGRATMRVVSTPGISTNAAGAVTYNKFYKNGNPETGFAVFFEFYARLRRPIQ